MEAVPLSMPFARPLEAPLTALSHALPGLPDAVRRGVP